MRHDLLIDLCGSFHVLHPVTYAQNRYNNIQDVSICDDACEEERYFRDTLKQLRDEE